nr:MAG TPA: hypothetical protein [Caudoviricetes sp.]
MIEGVTHYFPRTYNVLSEKSRNFVHRKARMCAERG